MSLSGLDITNKRSKIVFISLVYKKFSVPFEDTGIDAKLKISLKFLICLFAFLNNIQISLYSISL